MRPAGFGAEALASAVARGCGDDARRPGFLLDREVDHFGAVRTRQPSAARFNADALEQPGGDQRLAQIIDLAAVIQFAGLEPGQHRDVFCPERFVAFADDLTIGATRPGRDRQGIVGPAGILVEQNIALAHFGERIAVFGQCQRHLGFFYQHLFSADRIAELEVQGVADQPGRNGRFGLHCDARISEALARADIDHREQRLAVSRIRTVKPGDDLRIEPAFGGELLFE